MLFLRKLLRTKLFLQMFAVTFRCGANVS